MRQIPFELGPPALGRLATLAQGAMVGGVSVTARRRRPRMAGVVRAEWSELGTLGRTALVAVVLVAIVAVALAVSIPQLAKRYLLEAERDSLVRAVDDLAAAGLIPSDRAALDLEALVEEMATRLPGRGVVRIKIWTPRGRGDLFGCGGSRGQPISPLGVGDRRIQW